MDANRVSTVARSFAGIRLSRRRLLAASAAASVVLGARHPGDTAARLLVSTQGAVDYSAGLVDIGGRSLYMESHGTGGPTVVLEAGGLGRSDVWSRDHLEPAGKRTMVLPAVAGFTRVVTYDRPGTIGEVNPALDPSGPLFYPSRSDPVPQPRTARDVVADLHALLTAAAVPGPYVLVGHSLGGLCTRLFASTYPDEVAGMVLIDATHEDVWAEFKQALTPADWATFEALTTENPELMAVYPEAEQLAPAPLADTPTTAQMRRARADSPMRPMPLAVLSHGIPFAAPFPTWPSDEMERIMLALQDDLAHLVSTARHVIASESGHNIHQDQPELVIESVREVVQAVRDPSSWAVSTPIAASGDVSGLVDIGGRSLWLECRGVGGPTVVLEAGAGNNAQIWEAIALPPGTASTAVLPGLADFTRVCAYDRPGTILDPEHRSRSDPAPMPTTATDMVADLRALLEAADVPGPYVLVGHSYGGLIVRLFATSYPDEVVGLVLVNAAHEDYPALIRSILGPEQWAAAQAQPPELAGYDDWERIDADAGAEQMRAAAAASPLRPMPLAVLTHGVPWDWPSGFPADVSDAFEAGWRSLQDELVTLVPGARLVVAEQRQHYIQLDEPDLVIEAVRQVVEVVRNPSTWTASTPVASSADAAGRNPARSGAHGGDDVAP